MANIFGYIMFICIIPFLFWVLSQAKAIESVDNLYNKIFSNKGVSSEVIPLNPGINIVIRGIILLIFVALANVTLLPCKNENYVMSEKDEKKKKN